MQSVQARGRLKRGSYPIGRLATDLAVALRAHQIGRHRVTEECEECLKIIVSFLRKAR